MITDDEKRAPFMGDEQDSHPIECQNYITEKRQMSATFPINFHFGREKHVFSAFSQPTEYQHLTKTALFSHYKNTLF